MLRVANAILHVFDFVAGSQHLSEEPLDLSSRQVRSFVQRHLRKVSSSSESRRGEFAPDSGFARELSGYLTGGRDFVSFSREIAQWFWEELRRTEDLEQVDLLVADFTDTDAAPAAADGENNDAFDGAEPRRFVVLLLPRRACFAHEVFGASNGICRHDATLPSPSQKVASYVVVDADTLAVSFHDRVRKVGSEEVMVLPDRFLQCSSEASGHEVIKEVSVIVSDVAEEFGLTPAVEVGRAKASLARAAEQDDAVDPVAVGREIFEDRPEVRARFEERVAAAALPAEAPVRRAATRIARNHRIRTDTGIEITFPSDLAEQPGYLDFAKNADGLISITIGNVTSIENR